MRGGRTWGDYWNQLMGKILFYPMPSNDLPYIIISRTSKAHTRERLLLLGLMNASSKSASVPNIDLIGERMLKIKLRKSRFKDGKLKICKLSDFELHQERSILEILPSAPINQ